MVFKYRELNYEDNKDWLEDRKKEELITHIDNMAELAVMYDLDCGYTQACGIGEYLINTVSDYLLFSQEKFYTVDDIYKVYINQKWYIFRYGYIASNHIVLVCVKPKDIWTDKNDLLDEIEQLENVYFSVEY